MRNRNTALIVALGTIVILFVGKATSADEPTLGEGRSEAEKFRFNSGDTARAITTDALKVRPVGIVRLEVVRGRPRLIDKATKETVAELNGAPYAVYASKVNCWAFSPDGRFVVTGGGSEHVADGREGWSWGKIMVWDATTGKHIQSFDKYDIGLVVGVSFGEDNRTIRYEAHEYRRVRTGK